MTKDEHNSVAARVAGFVRGGAMAEAALHIIGETESPKDALAKHLTHMSGAVDRDAIAHMIEVGLFAGKVREGDAAPIRKTADWIARSFEAALATGAPVMAENSAVPMSDWVLVPREPTQEQLLAYFRWPERVEEHGDLAAAIYRRMVASAPTPVADGAGGDLDIDVRNGGAAIGDVEPLADEVLHAAHRHAEETGEPDNEVGDLQCMLRAALDLMTPAQRAVWRGRGEVQDVLDFSTN